MNREEKIEDLNDLINEEFLTLRGCYIPNNLKNEFQLLIKLLQIKPRTIEALEVGDLVYFKDNVTKKDTIFGLTLDEILQNEIHQKRIEIIKIIPHEFLSLWSDFHD